MKKMTLMILVFVTQLTVQAQSVKKLDEIFGFKNIKFMTHISEYKSKIALSEILPGGGLYNVLDKVNVGDVSIESATIHTINGYIYQINLRPYSSREVVLSTLNSLFGNPMTSVEKKGRLINMGLDYSRNYSYTWSGEKVLMKYVYDEGMKEEFGKKYAIDPITGKEWNISDDVNSIEIRLIDNLKSELVDKYSKPKSKDPMDDFSSDIVSDKITKEQEDKKATLDNKDRSPCYDYIEQLFVLNKQWYSSGNIDVYIVEDNHEERIYRPNQEELFDKFVIQIAKNSSQNILVLSRHIKLNYFNESGEKFIGNLEILLDDGSKITCIDRKQYGEQKINNNVNEIFNVYYLTKSECDKLRISKIVNVSFGFGSVNKYTQVSNVKNHSYQTYIELECVIDAINAHL